jgi:hypothetical protein
MKSWTRHIHIDQGPDRDKPDAMQYADALESVLKHTPNLRAFVRDDDCPPISLATLRLLQSTTGDRLRVLILEVKPHSTLVKEALNCIGQLKSLEELNFGWADIPFNALEPSHQCLEGVLPWNLPKLRTFEWFSAVVGLPDACLLNDALFVSRCRFIRAETLRISLNCPVNQFSGIPTAGEQYLAACLSFFARHAEASLLSPMLDDWVVPPILKLVHPATLDIHDPFPDWASLIPSSVKCLQVNFDLELCDRFLQFLDALTEHHTLGDKCNGQRNLRQLRLLTNIGNLFWSTGLSADDVPGRFFILLKDRARRLKSVGVDVLDDEEVPFAEMDRDLPTVAVR